mgnify:CR=1 FL=1
MCGVLGLFGKIDHRLHTMFETMLTLSQSRGIDSTGVAAIGTKVNIVKDTVFALDLLKSAEYKDKVLKNKNLCLLGHNRAATRGVVSKDNAHPFKQGNIVLVHNGTLWKNIKTDANVDTDSESICAGINEKGVAEVWKEMDGDATVLYFDTAKGTFNMVSNGKRPLVFAYTADMCTLIVASEKVFIEQTAERYGIKLSKNTVWAPKDNDLWTFSINKKGVIQEQGQALSTRPLYQTGYGFSKQYRYSNKHEGYTVILPKKEDDDIKSLPFMQGDVKFKSQKVAHTLSKEDWARTYHNCEYCQEALEYNASSVINGIAVCDGCIAVAEDNNLMISGLKGA